MPPHSRAAKRQAWIERLERFKQGGQTVAQVCAAEEVSVPSFYQWRRKLVTKPKTTPQTSAKFLPVQLPESSPNDSATVLAVDFRKGFDGLTGIVTGALGQTVMDGSLILFVNRKRDRIKALWWETGGLTLWYRRLEQGTVELPKPQGDQTHVAIDSVELAMWIAGVPLKSAKIRRKRMRAA